MDQLCEIVMTADDKSRITLNDGNKLVCADLVVSGTDQSGDAIYVLAEVAWTIRQQHVTLARRRARILQQATGFDTIAAVIGAAPFDGPPPEDVRVVLIPSEEELDAQYDQ